MHDLVANMFAREMFLSVLEIKGGVKAGFGIPNLRAYQVSFMFKDTS